MRGWFARIGQAVTSALEAQTRRLLEGNAYEAAVISAARALEVGLREALARAPAGAAPGGTVQPESGDRLSRLIEIAASRGLVQETDVSEIRDLQRLRNVLVHSAETPDDARARPLVEKALELIERLKAPPPAKPRRARS